MKIQIDDVVREATAEEIAAIEKTLADRIAQVEAEKQVEANKAAAAEKLATLGLTADEIAAFLG